MYRKITVGLSGGCELLFNKQPTLVLADVIPIGTSLGDLVHILSTNYISERPELFADVSGKSIRPGILVLVNGCDAEVLGGMSHILEENEIVEFILTLHGG